MSPEPSKVPVRRPSGAFVALAVAAFVYVTTELLPIGLLTVIAADLHQSRSQIGLLVTGYAVVMVFGSLPLTRLTARVPRRRLLAFTLGVAALATLLCAAAPTYAVLLVGRLLTALTQAIFWSAVTPTALGLFPAEVRGRMMARLAIGNSLALVLGVPAGTWLGQQTSWRTAFAVLAGGSALTCAAVAALVPTFAPEDGGAARGTAPDNRRYLLLVGTTTLAVCGFLTVQTYIAPFLLDVAGFAATSLSPLLFVFGLTGLVGALVVGPVLDRHPGAGVVVPIAVIAAALLGLYGLGRLPAPAVGLLALSSLAYSALVPAIGHRVMQVAPGSTDIAAAALSTAFNVGIAGGSLVGGALISSAGPRHLALVGGLLATAALALLLGGPRQAREAPGAPGGRAPEADLGS